MQDVVIVGGSFAGLTAAVQLGRASRNVTVVDAGAPRNRTSPAAHGVPGWDGTPPSDILARFRADARSYPTVTFVEDEALGATPSGSAFDLDLTSGRTLQAHRIILAHGVRDMLPDIPGVVAAWGKTLLHCPYCHGYEVRGRPLAVLANHAMSGHQAELLRSDWSDDVTLLTGIAGTFEQDAFDATGFALEPRPVARMIEGNDGITVQFEDGQSKQFAAIFVAPRVSLDGTPVAGLGCATADGPLGPFVQIGPMGQTSVAGVFAAGDCARPGHNVTSAIGDGAMAGIGCHQSLVFPNMIQPLEVSSHD